MSMEDLMRNFNEKEGFRQNRKIIKKLNPLKKSTASRSQNGGGCEGQKRNSPQPKSREKAGETVNVQCSPAQKTKSS